MNYDDRYQTALDTLNDSETSAEGVAMMKEVAEAGDTRAMCDYGLLFITPGAPVTQNSDEAFRWFLMAAEHSDDRGQFYVGKAYYDGQIVKQDYIQASKWFTLSAEKGYAIAQYYLGHMYYYGNGVPKDMAEALRWFKLSVDRQCNQARIALGDILADESYEGADILRAYSLYKSAMDDDYPPGFYKVGMMYYEGKGTPQNHIYASKIFRRGNELEDNDCCFMLGKMYYYGYGVEKDKVYGKRYIAIAEQNGSEEARDFLDSIDRTRKQQRGWNGATPALIPVEVLKTPDLLHKEPEEFRGPGQAPVKKRRFSLFRR